MKTDDVSRRNEAVTKRLFERVHIVTRMDTDRSGRRPDFLVTRKPQSTHSLLCEVKTIISAGHIRGTLITSLNSNLWDDLGANKACLSTQWTRRKISDVLSNAEDQRRQLLQARPELETAPFVIALFLDFFADIFDILPHDFRHLTGADHRTISALITVEINRRIRNQVDRLSLPEIEQRLRDLSAGRRIGLPPPEKTWKVLRNVSAERPAALTWFNPCHEIR